MLLSELPIGVRARVMTVDGGAAKQAVPTAMGVTAARTLVRRLATLGFIPGEPVQLVRRGPGGREPLAVQVGDSLFALRHIEAQCVAVMPEPIAATSTTTTTSTTTAIAASTPCGAAPACGSRA